MTSSESIDYSQYSIINEQNVSIPTDLELVDNQNPEKPLTELSQMLSPNSKDSHSDTNTNSNKEDKNNNSLSSNDSTNITVQPKKDSIHNLLYGNPIDCINPKFIGKSYAFLYDIDGEPKITIGPDCKYI